MGCPTQNGNPDLLLNYSARTLDPETSATFELHLQQCAECARAAAAQQQVWSALDLWQPQPVSRDFDQRLYSRIEAEAQRPWWNRLFSGVAGWKPAVAGAMVATALAAILLVPGETGTVDTGKVFSDATAKTDTLEPEQIERALEDMEMLRQLNSVSGNQPSAL